MQPLTAQDTSTLSLIASTRLHQKELNELLKALSPAAREIANAILEKKGQRIGKRQTLSAEAIEGADALLGAESAE